MPSQDTFQRQLESYASLLLEFGLNLQPGQNLIVNIGAPVPVEDIAPFARMVTRKAYEMGARNVYINWEDAEIARMRLAMAPEEALTDVLTWRIKWLEEMSEQGAAFLSLYAPDPDLYQGIDPQRIGTVMSASARAAARFAEATSKLRHPWCVASIATPAWARQVYPTLSEADALAALWEFIFSATRITTDDPTATWKEHLTQLKTRATYLTETGFRRLRYRGPGTDLTLELPERQVWISGGGSVSAQGIAFVPNIPTEEVFCLPVRSGTQGTVTSTMPLNHNGVLIEGIKLRFENGRIVEYSADTGLDTLRTIIEADDGSHYLGEVALVPLESPLNTGIPVRNTLFDENASCHLAIGRAYPICIRGGEEMAPEELAANGANASNMHVDFMIGSADLDIDGELPSGEWKPVFRKGTWAERV